MTDKTEKHKFHTESILTALWRNWALAVGAITLPLVLSLWIPKLWVSLLTLVEAWALLTAMKANMRGILTRCSMIMRIAVRVLLTTAIVMFAIVILCTDWLVPTVIHLKIYNSEIPFITCLVVFPVTAIVCALWLWVGLDDGHCRECQRRNGYYAGDSIGATLYYRETRYQASIMLMLSVVLGAVEYWYYFARYINSDLNAPDRFFFNYMPAAVYVISLVFMRGRYASMRMLYSELAAASPARRNRTIVRYLVFCGDEMLLHQAQDGTFDTPAEAVIGRTASIGDMQAKLLFEEMMGIDKFDMRYCFTNEGFASGSNMIHYAVFVDEGRREAVNNEDTWMNPYMIDAALASNALAPVLANELYRIHTITMAWKTYDRRGRRLYPIRHYRPTFRFRDLLGWDVDYDDQTWFDVANNNEDRRFYRMRSFWNNLTDVFRKKSEAGQ